MPASDIDKLTARIQWILGSHAAAFDTTVADDRFILEELQRALIETEGEVMRVLCEANHPMRVTFLEWSADLPNESSLPPRIGHIEAVRIKPYSAATTYQIAESTSRDNVRTWRTNTNNIFDTVAHDQSGSTLAGYYNITDDILSFTGYRAQVKACAYAPDYATPSLQVDSLFDSLLVAGTIPKLNKLGVPQALILSYGTAYSAGMDALRGGLQSAPEVSVAQALE